MFRALRRVIDDVHMTLELENIDILPLAPCIHR